MSKLRPLCTVLTAGLIAGSVTAAGFAQEAPAYEGDQIFYDCPMDEVREETLALVYKDLAGTLEPDEVDPKDEGLKQTIKLCIERHAIPTADREEYARYALGIMAATIADELLTSKGFDTVAIDEIFDVGPGNTNMVEPEISEEMLDRVFAEAVREGVSAEDTEMQTWAMLGVYASATAIVQRYFGDFKDMPESSPENVTPQ